MKNLHPIPQRVMVMKNLHPIFISTFFLSFRMAESVCTRRKALKVAVAALCCENGFSYAEDAVLETLTEMIQSCEYMRFNITMMTLQISSLWKERFAMLKPEPI